MLKLIDQLFDKIDKAIWVVVNQCLQAIDTTTEVFAAYLIQRKLFINLLSLQNVYLEVNKFAALLIVITTRKQ